MTWSKLAGDRLGAAGAVCVCVSSSMTCHVFSTAYCIFPRIRYYPPKNQAKKKRKKRGVSYTGKAPTVREDGGEECVCKPYIPPIPNLPLRLVCRSGKAFSAPGILLWGGVCVCVLYMWASNSWKNMVCLKL